MGDLFVCKRRFHVTIDFSGTNVLILKTSIEQISRAFNRVSVIHSHFVCTYEWPKYWTPLFCFTAARKYAGPVSDEHKPVVLLSLQASYLCPDRIVNLSNSYNREHAPIRMIIAGKLLDSGPAQGNVVF